VLFANAFLTFVSSSHCWSGTESGGFGFWDHFTHLCADGSVCIADHTGPCLGEVVTFKELRLPYIAKAKKSTLSGSRNPFSCERLLLSAVAAHNGFEERELFEVSS
jgi:hypothetical protein